MNLTVRNAELRELMDDPECDPERLRRTLDRFSIVNRVVAGWARTYQELIRPALAGLGRPANLLDLGCGAGDVGRRLVRAARRDGFEVTGLGVDPDVRAIESALDARPVPDYAYRIARSSDLVAERGSFDIVVSNHVLHHLDDGAFDAFIAESALLADTLCVHSDIRREPIAYNAYAVAITPIAAGSFLRTDGLRSIRRSYTPQELAAALPEGWGVQAQRPFRVLAVHRPAPA